MTPADANQAAAGGAAAALRIYMLTQLDDALEYTKAFDEKDADLVRAAWVELVKELCQRGAVRHCRVCGCTDAIACSPDGCEWIADDLCDAHPEERTIVVTP